MMHLVNKRVTMKKTPDFYKTIKALNTCCCQAEEHQYYPKNKWNQMMKEKGLGNFDKYKEKSEMFNI